MFRLEKRFTFPMGHRLCKHDGACFNFHGHNYVVLVGLKSTMLNKNDMIIDFSHLKEELNAIFDVLDHAFMINKEDKEMVEKLQNADLKVIPVDYDPTAERMAEELYFAIQAKLPQLRKKAENSELCLDYVTIFENENSKATFSEIA
jgi:6-pyruvoyltetrahydropterin/6-carboxytetrahydropterin synthase